MVQVSWVSFIKGCDAQHRWTEEVLHAFPPLSYWLKLCFMPPHSPASADRAQGWFWAKNPEQYHLSIGGRQDKCIAFFPTHLSPLFIPLLLPCLLFILMWSRWSSWWWHGVDYAVPTVTYSKEAEEGTIVASDLWMTALPVAPAPHWRAHGERGAGRVCRDMYSTCQTNMGFWRDISIPGHLVSVCWLPVLFCQFQLLTLQ